MKKMLALVLAMVMILCAALAAAEGGRDYTLLTVGTTTPFQGNFFTALWGNNGSDLDVRSLLHAYNLVYWVPEDGAFALNRMVVSGAAVSTNEAGDRTYTLSLYDDLYYSDGSPITAWDYAFSYLFHAEAQIYELGAMVRSKDHIHGYDAYFHGEINHLSGIRVLDDHVLAITVDHEYLPFFYEYGLLNCRPYPIQVIHPGYRVYDHGEGAYIGPESNPEREVSVTLLHSTVLDPENGYSSFPRVTSGPYRMVSYDGNSVELEINPYYKGDPHGAVPTIPRLIYKTVAIEYMLEHQDTGEIDLMHKVVSAEMIEKGFALAESDSSITYDQYLRDGLAMIAFCCERPTVNSTIVRQAISLCMDKDELVRRMVGDFGIRVDGLYGLAQWMYLISSGEVSYPISAPGSDASPDETAAYEEALAKWQTTNLDGVMAYNFDVGAAVKLLESDGWTLNREGGAFDPSVDEVRCKNVDGELVALDLKLAFPQENKHLDILTDTFVAQLAQAGIKLTIDAMPMEQLTALYYRQTARDCDMLYLATNFDVVFDLSSYFRPDTDTHHTHNNFFAMDDQELYNLATDMSRTEPDDLLGYMGKWVAFQQRFQELAPAIPLYSNVYFDFYPKVLHNYNVANDVGWGHAIVSAYLSDASEEGEQEASASY